MACNQNCNEGRSCDCDRSADKSAVVAFVWAFVILAAMVLAYGVFSAVAGASKGQECAVTVRFKDSSATYIGHSV